MEYAYITPNTKEELISARANNIRIELNGSVINGGYGETWRVWEEDDFDWSLSAYRICMPALVSNQKASNQEKTLDVEVTLKFQIPNDEDFMDSIYKVLKERIKNFDYKNEMVQYSIITGENKSIIYTQDRLEVLERAISLFKESLLPVADQTIETSNALNNHHKQARETYYK
jgi:hypothetical protein